jgi:hypothetical protein
MTYTKDYPMQEELISNIYFIMFVSDFSNMQEKYRIYVEFAHEYTKCFTGGTGLWKELPI